MDLSIDSTEDGTLMMRYQEKRDQAAFEALYKRHRVRVYNFLLRFVKNRSDAEDLLQKVFIKVATRAWKPEGSFKSWLYTVARNEAMSHLRPTLEKATTQAAEPIEAEGQVDPVEPDRALRSAVNGCIQTLSEEQKTVFLYRSFAELTFNEIAKMLDVPVGTAKRRMQLACKNLQDCLQTKRIAPQG